MKILCFCLAAAFAFSMCTLVSADEPVYECQGGAYLLYEYDSARSLLVVSVRYEGEKISAIGLRVAYDTDKMQYTSFDIGSGFSGFDVSATLENDGCVRLLAFSPSLCDTGEIIRLCFKVDASEGVEGLSVKLLPLTEKPCAVIENGSVKPINISLLGTRRIPIENTLRLEACNVDCGNLLVISSAKQPCFFDITIVGLCGEIRRVEAFCRKNPLVNASCGQSLYSLALGEIPDGYAAIIIDVYGKDNGNMLAGRGIFLLRDGKLI